MESLMIMCIIFICLFVFGIVAYIIYNANKSQTTNNAYGAVYGGGITPFCPPGCSRAPTGGCWKNNAPGRFKTPCPY